MPFTDTTTEFNDRAARRKINDASDDPLLDAHEVEYTPDDLADWDGVDPGHVKDALDYNADRLRPIMRLFDGMIEETTAISVTSNGSVITLAVEKSGGGDLNPYFAGIRVPYDTSPADTIVLTAGTDTSPQTNYVFLTESGGTVTLTVNTTGFPAGTPHVHLATVLCQSAASLQTDGPYKVHAWIDHLNDATADGHLSHINEKLRNIHATWISGVAPADLASALYLATTAGVVFQLHDHAMPARTMSGGPGDPVWIVNDPTTAYNRVTALSGITQDASGNPITNKYFNIVLWGAVSEDETDCKLFINLPSDVYTTQAKADADLEATSNFAIPSQFVGTGFLIARYTLRDQAGALTQSLKTDLRGQLPAGSPGGGPGITAHDDLGGLPGGDTHTQYLLADGTRPLSADWDNTGRRLRNTAVAEVGTTFPPSPATGQLFVKTDDVGGGVPGILNVTEIASTTTLDSTHEVVVCDAISAAFSVDLPAAASNTGRRYHIKKIDSSANAVTVDGDASETIDGSTTKALASQYDSVTIVCDGTEWWIL